MFFLSTNPFQDPALDLTTQAFEAGKYDNILDFISDEATTEYTGMVKKILYMSRVLYDWLADTVSLCMFVPGDVHTVRWKFSDVPSFHNFGKYNMPMAIGNPFERKGDLFLKSLRCDVSCCCQEFIIVLLSGINRRFLFHREQ